MSAAAERADDALYRRLETLVGAERVSRDPAECALVSQDVYEEAAHAAACVVEPRGTVELAQVVAAATAAGRAVIARGGGMSYTAGYLPVEPGTVMLDLRRMSRIVSIDETDMTVTVEAGCTWAALHEALAERGLRTPFWGPLSGLASTVGGGLAQNNAFFGAGIWGPSADSVLALAVVLADGSVLETGSASTVDGIPFFRHYGPDLTGLFLGDTGALGIKAEATLRLIPLPEAEGYASFEFADRERTARAMSAIARANVACELFGFDPGLQRVRMKRASLAADFKSLAGVVKRQKSLASGVKEAAKIALAGRRFADEAAHSVHAVVEGRHRSAVDADLALLREIAREHGGKEVENTIPKVVRATPFTPLNNMIGPEGERWAPIHGIVPHSRAVETWDAVQQVFDDMADAFDRHGITTGYLVTTLATTGFLIEPVFYWPESLLALHREAIEASHLAKIEEFAPNAGATAAVAAARRKVAEIFLAHGAAHFQIGKAYLYREGRKPAAWALLEALKSAVDPRRRINPGSLGLE